MKIIRPLLFAFRLAIKAALLLIAALIVTLLVNRLLTTPSISRDWANDQAILPRIEFSENGSKVTVHNIRNFRYRSTTGYDSAYYDKTFDLSRLVRADFMVEPFSGFKGSAHTFVTFGFLPEGMTSTTTLAATGRPNNLDYVAVSVEIRKEKGEKFSAIKGLLRRYELMYVVADERDVIDLRANYRHDQVYLYPVQTSTEKIRALFVDMLQRADKLSVEPEFYNTLTNTCTTNIVRHINRIVEASDDGSKKVAWWDLKVLLPANSDKLAYDIGLIDTELPFEEVRAKYLINERAARYTASGAAGSVDGLIGGVGFSEGVRR